LQLANFWQDLGVDTRRGRIYLPQSDRERSHVDAPSLLSQRDSPQVRRLVGEMVCWTRELMLSGAPLVHAIPGRAGGELRLVVQGGLRILDKIEALGFDTLRQRPRLNAVDVAIMLWRALWMRSTTPAVMREAA
jgi:phytoene/squalene synthetase